MAEVMAGPSASTWFREPATRMDVRWRIAAVEGSSPWVSPEERDQLLELSLTGAGMGWQLTMRQSLSHNEVLDATRRLVRGALSPSVGVQTGPGGLRLSADQAAQNWRTAATDITEGGGRAMPRSLRTGTQLRIARTELAAQQAGAPPLVLGPIAWAQGQQIGFDAFRAELRPLPRGPLPRWQAEWSVVARQNLHPQVALVGDLRGDERALSPIRTSGGLDLRPVPRSPFAIRTMGSVLQPQSGLTEEIRLDVVLRGEFRWRLPSDINRWPLGLESLDEGPWWPRLPNRGPNQLAEPIRPAWELAAK
jgi:hypothetical protein